MLVAWVFCLLFGVFTCLVWCSVLALLFGGVCRSFCAVGLVGFDCVLMACVIVGFA